MLQKSEVGPALRKGASNKHIPGLPPPLKQVRCLAFYKTLRIKPCLSARRGFTIGVFCLYITIFFLFYMYKYSWGTGTHL